MKANEFRPYKHANNICGHLQKRLGFGRVLYKHPGFSQANTGGQIEFSWTFTEGEIERTLRTQVPIEILFGDQSVKTLPGNVVEQWQQDATVSKIAWPSARPCYDK